MKLLILLALASFTVAQFPLETVDPQGIYSPSDMVIDPTNPWMLNNNRWGGFVGGMPQRGPIYGANPYATPFPTAWGGLPSYGPFVRYGNRVVPYSMWPTTTPYGGIPINRYQYPIGPFTPIGVNNPMIQDPLLDTIVPRYGSPYSPITPMIQDPLMPQYGDEISQMTMPQYGSPINMPYGGPIMPYENRPYGNDFTTYPYPQFNPIDSTNGFTPYSQAALFNLITRGGVGKLDLYSKLILGRSTGLSRKMREVCPEVDGGLSYVSCLTDAHSKTFRCLKGIESHPRYLTCTHKPIVKKVMRDWYVHDFNWHKEIVKCLSTTTYQDKVTEKITGVPLVPTEDDLSDSSSDEDEQMMPFGTGKVGWNVEFGVSTRQCFFKLRKETSKCSQLASQCPKFKKCYIHPTIKTLEVRKHIKQAKFVKLLDSCLAGTPIPEELVPEDITPMEPIYPADMPF